MTEPAPHSSAALAPKLQTLLDQYPILAALPDAHCDTCQRLYVALTFGMDVLTAFDVAAVIRAAIAEAIQEEELEAAAAQLAAEAAAKAEADRLAAEDAARAAAEAAAALSASVAQPTEPVPAATESEGA